MRATFSPRALRRSVAESDDSSTPSTRTRPEAVAPPGRMPRIPRPRVDLPHPLSPTRPTLSPRRTSRLTPSTATTGPRAEAYVTRRSRTDRATSAGGGTAVAVAAAATAGPGRPPPPPSASAGGDSEVTAAAGASSAWPASTDWASIAGVATVAARSTTTAPGTTAPTPTPRRRSRGLMMSLIPSPSRVRPVTRARMNMPGKNDVHQKPLATSPMAREMS